MMNKVEQYIHGKMAEGMTEAMAIISASLDEEISNEDWEEWCLSWDFAGGKADE